jgi:hypothetical protein
MHVHSDARRYTAMGNAATKQYCRTFTNHETAKPELVTAPADKSPDQLMNSQEVADMLGVDISWVKNHTTRVEPYLPFVKLGGGRYAMRRFRRDHILKFIEENTYTPRKMA